ARLCHELIGPVAAIGNGVELLAEEEADFVREAVALVEESARKANRRLQFYRFAYGFSGGELTGPPPHQLAGALFADSGVACEYREAVRALPLERQKLACNMLAIGGEALSRGGRIVIDAGAVGPELEGAGEGAGPSVQICDALTLALPVGELTSRNVGAYFTGLVAAGLGCRIIVDARPGGFRLGLVAAGTAAG
ncbi:MAG TPA: histidine phosphotransferase family protein, partial [Stellaceae bacterium]|nr:histidine phosphotransferase family protein [Stellaceae bacterium]